jgi:hypothetical protein
MGTGSYKIRKEDSIYENIVVKITILGEECIYKVI